MKTQNVRVLPEVYASLKTMADSRGISLQQLVNQVLDREVRFGPTQEGRPLYLPPGLGPLSQEFVDLTSDLQPGVEPSWVFEIRGHQGQRFALVGTIVEISPMVLCIGSFGGAPRVNVARDAILSWVHVGAEDVFPKLVAQVQRYVNGGAIIYPTNLATFARYLVTNG